MTVAVSRQESEKSKAMIVWQGLIGKMVGFLATKLLGKKIDLLLDDRRKAARAFVKLYNAITELEQVTSLLIKELNDIKKGKSKFISGRSLSFISKANRRPVVGVS